MLSEGDTTRAERVFLCRSFDSPLFYGVVVNRIYSLFTPHHPNYGSPGGAAFGLAGILQSRYSYPVWATTHERRNSGGSVTRYLKEIATMATIPALPHPQFTFVFLAVRRSDYAARPFAVRTVATCERAARLKLVADFVLSFAARIPMNNFGEVNA